MSVAWCLVGLAVCAAASADAPAAPARRGPALVFCCREDNDLYGALAPGLRRRAVRFDSPREALAASPDGGAVLLLADGYPDRLTTVEPAIYDEARRRGLRLFVEYPGALPGLSVGEPRQARFERAVVASEAFGPALPRLSILTMHGCRFAPIDARGADIVMARVAGFDRAVYGLPERTWPILFEARPGLLVATSALSRFVTGRYAPAAAWGRVWEAVLDRLDPGGSGHAPRWRPAVRPTCAPGAALPADAERRALRRGVDWFRRARMLVHPAWRKVYDEDAKGWPDRVGPAPSLDWPVGDGSLGVLEGFDSAISADGSQRVRWWRRNDCTGELAGAMALAGRALRDRSLGAVAGNLGDFLYTRSILSLGRRADPADPAYGLIGWNDVARYHADMDGYGVYYGDDSARSMLGMMAAAGVLRTGRWDERLARCLLANLRLTSRRGFQPNRIDEAPLQSAGWRAYFRSDTVSLAPHYQAYLWACFLRAYQHSGYEPFLSRARAGITATMAAYPDCWTGPSDMQMARARMLLPLAWLVRVDETPEHRAWLRRMANDMLARQDACGAIREDLPGPAMAEAPAPASNEAYGTGEAPLVHSIDDPCADLLYTNNFALLGLHEAAAATGDAVYRDAEGRLAGFLCRVQARSESRPELNGAWFRAFDFGRWEFWASSADVGWGAWCVETGWTQTWITAVLAMRRLHTCLWDAAGGAGLRQAVEAQQSAMIPDDALL